MAQGREIAKFKGAGAGGVSFPEDVFQGTTGRTYHAKVTVTNISLVSIRVFLYVVDEDWTSGVPGADLVYTALQDFYMPVGAVTRQEVFLVGTEFLLVAVDGGLADVAADLIWED